MRAIYGLDRRLGPLRGKNASQVAEWVARHRFNAVFGGYRDRKLVRALQRLKIKVFAEIPLFVGHRHWRKKGGRPVTAAGRGLRKQGWYAGVCPNQPALQAQQLRLIRRVVQRHKVDGIWLDFIRYPARWERARQGKALPRTCFCRRCLGQFSQQTGVKLPSSKGTAGRARWILTHHHKRWVQFKTGRIVAFVRRARQIARQANPGVLVGLFAVPWRATEYRGAIHAVIGQDFRQLASHVDIFSPMLYHHMAGRDPAWIHSFVGYLHKLTGKPVLPIIQACSVPRRLSQQEFADAVTAAQKAPSRGVILFSLKHFLREKRSSTWLKTLEEAKILRGGKSWGGSGPPT